MAVEHLSEDTAYREDIDSKAIVLSREKNLGGTIQSCRDVLSEEASMIAIKITHTSEPKVTDREVVILVDKDI